MAAQVCRTRRYTGRIKQATAAAAMAFLAMVYGCAGLDRSKQGGEAYASPILALNGGAVLIDNDDAFEAKLKLIDGAKGTLRLAYYIYGDDYSSRCSPAP